MCCLGVIIGLIYWQLDTQPNGFTDRLTFDAIALKSQVNILKIFLVYVLQRYLVTLSFLSGMHFSSVFPVNPVLKSIGKLCV